MFVYSHHIKVRYAETSPSGGVHHANFAIYHEEAQIEALEQIRLSYKAIEAIGIIIPVVTYDVEFYNSAYFGDELLIKTIVAKKPTVKILFEFETYNQSGQLLNKAWMKTAIVDQNTGRPCYLPEPYRKAIDQYF